MQVVPVPLSLLSGISVLRVSLTPDLRTPDARRAMLLLLQVRHVRCAGLHHSALRVLCCLLQSAPCIGVWLVAGGLAAPPCACSCCSQRAVWQPNRCLLQPCLPCKWMPLLLLGCAGRAAVGCCSSTSWTPASSQRHLIAQALLKNYPEGLPMLDPISDMKISDPGLPAVLERLEALERKLEADPVQLVGGKCLRTTLPAPSQHITQHCSMTWCVCMSPVLCCIWPCWLSRLHAAAHAAEQSCSGRPCSRTTSWQAA